MVSGAKGRKRSLLPLPRTRKLGFGKQHVFRIQSQHFGGAKPMHEHQAYDGQVARGTEAGPESRHFIHGERHDVSVWAPSLATG